MAKKLSITPLHDRVIVKAAAAEEKSAGGIIIPDTAKEKPQRGVVVAAGPGKKDEPVTVKAGDAVLYAKDKTAEALGDILTQLYKDENLHAQLKDAATIKASSLRREECGTKLWSLLETAAHS